MAEDQNQGGGIFGFVQDLRDVLDMAPGAIQETKEKIAAALGSVKNPVVTATLLQQVDMGDELLQVWHVKTLPQVVLGIATKNVRLCACFVSTQRPVEECQKLMLRWLVDEKDEQKG